MATTTLTNSQRREQDRRVALKQAKRNIWAYAFISPFYLLYAVFGLFPLLYGLWLSLQIAFLTACGSVVLGTFAAFALVKYKRFGGRTLFSGMVNAPLVMPEVVVGLSLLLMLVSIQRATQGAFGWGFPERGLMTIWLGHLLLGQPKAVAQFFVGAGLFQGVEVGALNILDQRQFQHSFRASLFHHYWHAL